MDTRDAVQILKRVMRDIVDPELSLSWNILGNNGFGQSTPFAFYNHSRVGRVPKQDMRGQCPEIWNCIMRTLEKHGVDESYPWKYARIKQMVFRVIMPVSDIVQRGGAELFIVRNNHIFNLVWNYDKFVQQVNSVIKSSSSEVMNYNDVDVLLYGDNNKVINSVLLKRGDMKEPFDASIRDDKIAVIYDMFPNLGRMDVNGKGRGLALWNVDTKHDRVTYCRTMVSSGTDCDSFASFMSSGLFEVCNSDGGFLSPWIFPSTVGCGYSLDMRRG